MAPRGYDAILGLGSNIGDKRANILRAVDLLTADGELRLVRLSKLYRTAPWGVEDQDWFVNACATIETEASARDLLGRCQTVEAEMRRVRDKRWGPRIIDVDILSYRDAAISENGLVVPHPRIADRAFVLIPMKDVAPDFQLGGRSLDDMIAAVGAGDVAAMDGAPQK
ncbi:MAG: 2-amino-4-hydroxy-6-hydroxymethyldihydropteridine diphosphokinase [Hyphomicrobium sp.]